MSTKGEAKALCKYTGDAHVPMHVTPMSLWNTQNLLVSVADRDVCDKGLRFMVALACSAQEKPLQLTFGAIGHLIGCSERQAKRLIAKLGKAQKVRIERNGKQTNRYSLYSVRYNSTVMLQPCAKCGKGRIKLFAGEICDKCTRERNLKAKVRAFRKENPGQPLSIQFSGARMSRTFMKVARELDDEERAS